MEKFSNSSNNLAEFRGQVVDVFEDFCDEYGIRIENKERDEYNAEAGYEEGENTAIIFGSDYDLIADEVTDRVNNADGKESFTPDEVSDIADALMDIFDNQILKERGTIIFVCDPLKVELKKGIVDTFRAWDLISE